MRRVRLIQVTVLVALVAAFVVGRHFLFPSGGFGAQAALEQGSGAQPKTPPRAHGTAARAGGPTAVLTAVAKRQDVPITESAVGWVEPIASVAVRPRIDGVIVAQTVHEGQTVKAGDLLFQLDDKALQAMLAKDRAALAKDQANSEQLRADLARLKTLNTHNDATAQQVEQQQAAVNQGAASIAGDQAQIEADQVQIGYTKITAPIDGRVGAIDQDVGTLVRAADQTTLLTVTQMAPVRVSFSVPERDLAALRQALGGATPAAARVFDPESSKVLSTGALTFVDSSVDTASGTVTAKADFDNGDGALWPGQYVRVEADLGVRRGVTVVPLAALQVNEKGSYVFVAKPDGTATTKPVTVVDETGDTAIVSSGLDPDEHVVVEGQLRLRDGARIKETLASNAAAGTQTGASADAAQ